MAGQQPTIADRCPGFVLRLDQALGLQSEPVSPVAALPHFGVRMSFPEPIGLQDDVMAALSRLLDRLCAMLAHHDRNARRLRLELSRVDRETGQVEIGLARAMRDADRVAALFTKGVENVEAGLAPRRCRRSSFLLAPAVYSEAETPPARFGPDRSIILFPPEPVTTHSLNQLGHPPARFRWRRMRFTTLRATGPERIAPEWWFDDPNWRSGLRDYWRVETREGLRLWLFHTPQASNWFGGDLHDRLRRAVRNDELHLPDGGIAS